MKYFSKLSLLFLFAIIALCACDNNNGESDEPIIGPGTVVGHVVDYSVEVQTVVDAPQIHEEIEQDLAQNPPFGGSKLYRLKTRKVSVGLPTSSELLVQNLDGKGYYGGYRLNAAGECEVKDNYRLFPIESNLPMVKWEVVPITSENGKPVATYDIFVNQPISSSYVGSKLYFCEDLTENYRQRYPDADIHAVVRRQVLTYVKSENIINE